MEFMGFHTVDIIITALVLFLAIKGFMHGFSKELFNFLTIIGGIALGAKFNLTVVEFINEQQFIPTISDNYARIVGFIIMLIAVWMVVGVLSSIINRVGSLSISPISRILGYFISAIRYVAIFALIIFGVDQSEFFKNEAKKLKTETKLFIPMTKIGATILNIDLNNKVKENNSSNTILNNHETNETTDNNSSEKNSHEENLTSTPEDENLLTEHNTTE